MTPEIFVGDGLLQGKNIFLSASKPSRDLDLFRPTSEADMEEAVRCFARAVFAEGGHLVFGAHPSISPLIVDIATEYFPPRWDGPGPDPPVTIYQSDAFRDAIPPATRELERLGYARIIQTKILNGEHFDPEPRGREQCLVSLAHMRQRMFEETQPAAMVAAGGMQGIIREARLFLELFQEGNVYTLPFSGGAAERLAERLQFNQLREETALSTERLYNRLIEIDWNFAKSGWQVPETSVDVPERPYTLLMQKLVRRIGGVEDSR